MKIIVTYASAGSGHFKAAEAIYNYLKSQDKNLELELIDVLENSNILFANFYSYGYRFAVSYAPFLWALGFHITYARALRPVIKFLRFIINRLNTKRFARLLIQENPNFIISTHFLPSEISAYLKRSHRINSKLFTVITDFSVHPFWISEGTDFYIVASHFAKEQLVSEGVKENNIKECGIPVDSKFLRRYERSELSQKFGIDQNKFTVLIATGSFGIGPIEEIVELLYKDAQILAVCANNRRLYTRLKNKNYPNVKVFGFIDNIQELMAVSDIIITKAGGLTISEILAMELVPVFISAIPGQEAENIRVLRSCGIGITMENTQDIKDIILDYNTHLHKLKSTKDKMAKIKKPFATEEVCNVICQGSIGDTC